MLLKHATLWPKIVEIKPKLFKPLGTEYVNPNTYSWLFTENIGQYVRYSNEILTGSFPYNNMSACQKWVQSGQYFP